MPANRIPVWIIVIILLVLLAVPAVFFAVGAVCTAAVRFYGT